jgi:hypothetical protein
MHFFTSITANYLPKARVLAHSVKKHHPDAVFHLVFSDKLPDGFDVTNEPFDDVIFPEDFNISSLDSWIFKHTVVELCTAVKAPAFLKIFQSTNADKVIYLDPDIAVFHRLDELSQILDQHSVVLTPHQVTPETTFETIKDNEICSLKHGVYNLGFLAVRRSEAGLAFLNWWRDRVMDFCYDDIPNGLFTDQKWIDLAPAFFEDLKILRDKTYNVATWNISHRKVEKAANHSFVVEGSPIKFYHFSGFDSGAYLIMLKKYGSNNPALLALRDWYIKEIDAAGQNELGKCPCKYNYFSNGEPITQFHRFVYRTDPALAKRFPKPYWVSEDESSYYCWFAQEFKDHQINPSIDELRMKEIQLNRILNSRTWKVACYTRNIIRRIVSF